MIINYQLTGNDPMLAEMGQTVPLNYIIKKVTVDSKTTIYWVPKINENRDYQEYLAWVAKGNTPEAAD
tara:strand:+ start:4072 stop:4275 length:204 start_codon:yes stop_codon:yes gene_type:complete